MVADNVQVIQMPDYFYRTNPASTTVTFEKKKIKNESVAISGDGRVY